MAWNHTYIPHSDNPVSSLKLVAQHTSGSPRQRSGTTDIDTMQKVRDYAREMWSRPDTAQTTYGHNHGEKQLHEPTRCRPTSPDRLNNPHPDNYFLVNRLKGFNGDGNVQPSRDVFLTPQQRRRQDEQILNSLPGMASQEQQHKLRAMSQHLAPTEAQALAAWMKMANTHDRNIVLDNGREKERQTAQNDLYDPSGSRRYDQSDKNRGTLARLATSLRSDPDKKPCPSPYKHHMDYCIHPDWPPTLHHHRIHVPRK